MNNEDLKNINKPVTPSDEGKQVAKPIKEMTVSEVDAELAASELELKRLELLEKKLNLTDLKARIEERALKTGNKESVFRGYGQNLAQDQAKRLTSQANCNHRKGGDGARGLHGDGTDLQYAILRHRMQNGDIWVRCLRCGKTWKPAVKSQHTVNGVFNVESFNLVMKEYQEALKWPTRNHTSGTQQFEWGLNDKGEGGKEFFRERMKNVTLE